MKPIIYLSLDHNDSIVAIQVTHPTSPPADGLAWITYVPASTNLAGALQENDKLMADNNKLRNELRGYERRDEMRAAMRAHCDLKE